MKIKVDGQIVSVPDDATPEEIDALTRPQAPPPDPGAMAMEGMSPLERRLAAIGGGMVHSVKQAGNLLGKIGVPGMPTDADMAEEAKLNKALFEAHPWMKMAGDMAVQAPLAIPLGGGAGMAAKGVLPRALAALRAAGAGAAQGGVFSDPGQRETGAVTGGVLGGTVAAAAEPLAALAGGALKRANRMAVNIFEPDARGMTEIAQKYARPGLTLEDAVDEAGAALRKLRGAKGERAIDPHMTLGQRANFLRSKGEDAGRMLDDIMREADALGLKGDPEKLLQEAYHLKNTIVGGRAGALTETDIAATAEIDGLIGRLKELLSPDLHITPIEGTLPAVTRPLKTPVRNAAGEIVDEVDTIAKNQVGAIAPERARVFEPPVEVGKVQGKDPVTKRFRKAEPGPQPHLQKSEVVEIPAGEMSTAEGLGKEMVPGQPGPYGYESPVQDYLRRNRAQPEFPASRPTGSRRGNQWYTPTEEVLPQRQGVIGASARLEQQPLSLVEEAKRKLQQESFVRKGSGKYRDAQAAMSDPFMKFERRLSGALRQHVEDRLLPSMREDFIPAKDVSQLTKVFGDMADSAAAEALVRRGGTGGSLRGTIYRRAFLPIERNIRPYGLKAEEAMSRIGNATPKNMDALIRALMIQAAQQEE